MRYPFTWVVTSAARLLPSNRDPAARASISINRGKGSRPLAPPSVELVHVGQPQLLGATARPMRALRPVEGVEKLIHGS